MVRLGSHGWARGYGDIYESDAARMYWNLQFGAVMANVVRGLELRLILAQKERDSLRFIVPV